MPKLKLLMLVSVLAMLVSACSTSGQVSSTAPGVCVGAVRLRAEIIEQLTGEEARQLLDVNEDQQRRGCAVPNT